MSRDVRDSLVASAVRPYHEPLGLFGTLAAAEAALREALCLPDFYPARRIRS